MKLQISGVQYDYQRALGKAKLTDLYDLKVAAGIGARSINAALYRIGDASASGDAEAVLSISEEPDVLMATQGLVFLCRRFVGDKVTFEESAVSYDELKWIVEDGDLLQAEEANPPAESGGATQPSDETANETASKPKTGGKKPSTQQSKT